MLRMAAMEPRAYTVRAAIGLIHAAGGVASLAHPSKLLRGQPLLDAQALRPFVALGLDAIEAWQWIPGNWGNEHYRAIASDLDVLVSGGSDDHGKRTSDGRMRLGAQQVGPEVLEALRSRARQLRLD